MLEQNEVYNGFGIKYIYLTSDSTKAPFTRELSWVKNWKWFEIVIITKLRLETKLTEPQETHAGTEYYLPLELPPHTHGALKNFIEGDLWTHFGSSGAFNIRYLSHWLQYVINKTHFKLKSECTLKKKHSKFHHCNVIMKDIIDEFRNGTWTTIEKRENFLKYHRRIIIDVWVFTCLL